MSAELLQATVAARSLADAAATARSALGLPPGFPDPELAAWGIVNEVLNLGRTYLEIVAPARDGSSLERFLARGEGGYVVGVKIASADALAERCAERNVRVAHRQPFQDAEIVQLHPADLGVMLEADEIPAAKHWHYDDWDVPPVPPGAAGDLLAVDVAVADPEAAAELWAYLLDAERAAPAAVRAGGLIRFVPATGRTGLVAADLRGSAAAEFDLAGLTVRLVPEEGA